MLFFVYCIFLATCDCFILIYYALREKNDKKTSCFNDLFIRRTSDSGTSPSDMKGVPFLKKKNGI